MSRLYNNEILRFEGFFNNFIILDLLPEGLDTTGRSPMLDDYTRDAKVEELLGM